MRSGPEFIRFLKVVIDVLKSLDGSGTAAEVTDLVIERMNIPDEELAVTLKNGTSRVKNQIHWARLYLVKYGAIDNSKRGVWSLTTKGEELKISRHKDALEIFDSVQRETKVLSEEEETVAGAHIPNEEEVADEMINEFNAPTDRDFGLVWGVVA